MPIVRPSLVAMLLVLAATTAAASDTMNASQIEQALGGIILDGIYADGTYFTEAYHDDHTIRYWDADGAASGEWSIEDGLFCTFYENLEGACFAVEGDGDNCFTFFEMDPDNPAVPLEEWTSRGWNRARPSTCSTRPEVAL